MKNTVTKKFLAGAMLLAFALPNSSALVLASEVTDYINATNVNGMLLADDLGGLRGFSSSDAADVFSGISAQNQKDLEEQYKPTERIKLKGEKSLTDKVIPVTLSLRDSDITQVLRMFADKAGLNIIFDANVSGTITMDLVDVPINDAFELIMEMNQLYYLIDNNTLIVYSDPANSTLNMKELIPIPVKYVDAMPMAKFLNENIFGLRKPGISNTLVATTNPRKNEVLIFGTENDAAIARKIIEQFDVKPVFKTYKVNHVTSDVMAEMICTQLLPTIIDIDAAKRSDIGQITGAAASSKGISIGGSEIACGYSSDMKTTSSSASGVVSFSSLPLLALEISYSPGLGTISVMGANPNQLNMIEDFIKANDKKEPQAYLEVSIIELNESGSRTLNNTWQFMSDSLKVSFASGNTKVDEPIYFIDNKPGGSNTKTPWLLSWTINYLLENNKGRVVANPRILITNSEEAVIDLTSDYVKTVTSQVVQGVQQATSQRDYEIGDDNGIKVTITPFISPDGYVTMDIVPEYATISEQIYAPSDEAGGEMDLVATLLQRRDLDLKKVRIKDGETLIIGGMLRDTETKQVQKIPILGDLPYIGAIFRSSNTEKTKEEMIIMITPRIITDNEDAVGEQETL